MNFRELLADDDAVSPVIGVILMVAITVILAAVIGTFVLGLGDQVSQSQPSANIAFSYSDIELGGERFDKITITHKGGDKLNGNNLKITVDGNTTFEGGTLATDIDGADQPLTNDINQTSGDAVNQWDDESITAGDRVTIQEADNTPANSNAWVINDGSTVRIIWSADNGDTAIIAEGTVQ